MKQSDFTFSIAMRDLITRIAHETVNRLRPAYRYGTVVDIDRANYKCTVTLNGDDAPVIVNMGGMQPRDIGQTVRVEGIGTDRFISDVIGEPLMVATLGYDGKALDAFYGLNTRIPNGKLSTDAPNTYPAGLSSASVITGNGWPATGTVLTLSQESTRNYTTQVLVGVSSINMQIRRSSNGTSWSSWTIVAGTQIGRTGYMANASQSISNSTWASVSVLSEYISGITVGSHSSVSIIPETGVYSVTAAVLFDVASSGARGVRMLVNGDTGPVRTRGVYNPVSSSSSDTLVLATNVRYLAGDEVAFQALQASGASLNILQRTAGVGTRTWFSINKISD